MRVHAAPAGGEANRAVCRLLARALGVPPGAVALAGGPRSRQKRLRVEGDPVQLRARLQVLAAADPAV